MLKSMVCPGIVRAFLPGLKSSRLVCIRHSMLFVRTYVSDGILI